MSGRITDALIRSAWPQGSLDSLLRAVVLADRAGAADAWRAFEANADFDRLNWGEFRLISLAARRLAELAPDSPMRPRIAGIERSIWSRSQLAIGETATGLRELGAASVAILVVKGAARAAMGGAAARGRIVNDIDVVVRPPDMERAFDILIEDGWIPSASGSPLYHRSRLAGLTGVNLVRGEFGNIDLHRTPFKTPFDSLPDDAPIWDRSQPGRLGYAQVRVPAPLDTLTIAVAHGSLDAHRNSDWLADIAMAVDAGVDWAEFEEIAARRRLSTAAAIALGYVRERLERDIPSATLARLEAVAGRNPLRLVAAIAEARPKSTRFGLFSLPRALAKQSRLLRVYRRANRKSRIVIAWPFVSAPNAAPAAEAGLRHEIALTGRIAGQPWSGRVDIRILVELPPAARRVEFELNTPQRHLMRLRAVTRNAGRRLKILRFRTGVALEGGDTALVLEAVPARSFNSSAPKDKVERYAATPFRPVAIEARPD